MSVGLLYFELELDTTKFVKQQNDLNAKIKNLAQNTNEALQLGYQNLGLKSDAVYQQMANVAIKSYEKIVASGTASDAELVRSRQAMVSQINAINAKMNAGADAHYTTLGMKSAADVKQRIADVNAAAIAQQAIVGKSSEDWIRIERAKNEKLKELNKEMTGDHEMSMASMTRAVLRFYAAYYVISTVAQVVGSAFMSGIKAIDDMKVSVISVAAQITSMQGTTGDVTKNYRDNVKYAEALVPVLQQIDANSFANLSQIQKMNMAMINQGVILDVNNEKQIESFTALTNAVALFTQGQDKEKQASQEIRSLMSGQIRAGDMVAMQMDALIKKQGDYKGGLQELVKEGKKHGDTLERMKPYLIGIVAASGDINKTWMAVSSSLETAWNIIQRGLFKDVYKDLVESGMEATKWLKANQDEVVQYIKIAWGFIADAFTAAWNVLKGFVPIMKDFGMLLAPIIYGWGGVLAALKPIGAAIGNAVAMTYALGKAIVSTAMAGSRLAVFDYEGVKLYWNEAKNGYSEVWRLQKKNFDLVTTGVADAVVAYDKQYEAAKKATGSKVTAPIIPPGADKPTKDSVKDHMESLQSKMQADKAYYDEQVKTAEQVAKLSQRAGQDEFTTIKILYDTKKSELLKYRDIEYENAKELVRLETAKAKIGKDGEAKRFNSASVLAAKIAKIDADTSKSLAKNEGDRAIAIEDANKMTIQTMANLYKTIDEYSLDSMDYQVKQIRQKYLEDGRYASATAEQRKTIEAAMNADILKLTTNNELAKHNIQMQYQEVVNGPYSSGYMQAFELSLIEQANLEEKKIGESFNREEWLTQKKNEELAKRLDAQASYYMAIGGMEDKATQASLAAIEVRRKLDIKAYGDESAANKSAEQKKEKLVQDSISGIESRYDTEHKYQKETITNAIAVFDNASALMDKESTGYKLMQDMKKAALIAEQTMIIAKNMAVLSGIPAIAAATTAEAGLAVTTGATATLNAGASGDGYTAFARVAAMMAIVAAVLSAAGIASGSSSSSASATTSASLPASTVLGATNGTGSESIENSNKILEDIYSIEYRELRGIHQSMKDLNNNITGLVTSIVRTGDVGSWGAYADTMGQMESLWSDAANSAIGGLFSGHLVSDALFGKDSVITGFLTYISDLFTGWTGSLFGSIFGGGSSTTLDNSGLSMGSSTAGSYINGGTAPGYAYANYHKHTEGGWFSSDKDEWWNEYRALDAQTSALFTKVFKSMSETLVALAPQLGVDIQKVLNYTFAGTTLNLQGMSSETISKTLKEYFSALGDTAVDVLFGSILRQYQEVGEGMMETAVRIITDKAVVMESLDKTGQTFYGTVQQIIAFSESLITMSGGLDKFTEYVDVYYEAFFSDAEKMMNIRDDMQEAFDGMDMAMPRTRSAYRDIVEGLDLMTESGKQTYVSLMMMAEASDKYYDMLDEVIGQLKSARESMKMEGMLFERQQTVSAQLAFNAVLDQARQGNFANIGSIDNALSTITSSASSTSQFATRQEYQANFYKTYNSIAEMEGLLGGQIPIQEQQLAVLHQIAINTGKDTGTTGFANGGISTGSESGYEAILHGTELVVSPRKGYPVTFKGGDNGALVAEVKSLRAELYAITTAIATNTGKSAKITDRWDIDGLPSTRTNV